MIASRIFYALAAVAVVPLSFVPMFGATDSGGIHRSYDQNVYRLAGRGFTVDELAVVMVYALVVLLLIAGVWAPRTVAPQLGILVLCVIAVVLLIVKPQTSDPKPPLSTGGAWLLGLAVAGALVAFGDVLAGRSVRHRRALVAG